MLKFLSSVLVATMALAGANWAIPGSPAFAVENLQPIVSGLPWPSATRLIAFRGDLWFVNSVKGRNHNSADIYSVDFQTQSLRYRHHLFSQDAGHPITHDGLLYWPMEDDRFSLGWGTVAVTDGERWHHLQIPGSSIFHTHALAVSGGKIVAANSGWDAILNTSTDMGKSWQEVYRHPTPNGRVSRMTSLVHLNGALLARLRERTGISLVHFDGQISRPVQGWPIAQHTSTLAATATHVFAGIQDNNGKWELWSTDGVSSKQVSTPFEGQPIADVLYVGTTLWVLTRTSSSSGRVWSKKPGRTFEQIAAVDGGFPRDLEVGGRCIFVGGDGQDGSGMVWGEPDCDNTGGTSRSTSIDPKIANQDGTEFWSEAAQEIRAVLASPERYRAQENNLRDVVYKFATQHPPERFFGNLTSEPLPHQEISMIGGRVRIPSHTYARWVMLWGMGLAKENSVPLEILTLPWSTPTNRAEKYFDNLPAALWAIRNANQNNRKTLSALVRRLSRFDDPQWLRHQVCATLSALTKLPFTTDVDVWQKRLM